LKNTYSLLPGEIITIPIKEKGKRNSLIIGASAEIKHTNPTDEELSLCLEDSVRHHLISDVPIGLFFSGGTDSSVLAMFLKKTWD